LDASIDLRSYGVHSIAWRYKEAVQIIKIIRENSWVILGIDTFELRNNHMDYFIPNFCTTIKDLKSDDCAAIAYNKALDYIEWQASFGEQYWYDISATKQIIWN
jgi:hypothetical protein